MEGVVLEIVITSLNLSSILSTFDDDDDGQHVDESNHPLLSNAIGCASWRCLQNTHASSSTYGPKPLFEP